MTQMLLPVALEDVLFAHCISETIFEFALHKYDEHVKPIFCFHIFAAGESAEESVGYYPFTALLESVTPVYIPEDAGVS